MARDTGHLVEIRARIRHALGGVARSPGTAGRAGHPWRALAGASSALLPSIPVPDLSVPAARLSRPPASVAARVGAPS